MFVIYKTYISHITFMFQDVVYFWSFLIKLVRFWDNTRYKNTVSVLQVIAKFRIPVVISSGVSIVFKSFVPVCRMILSSFCSTVGMTKDFMSLVFAPLKCFTATLQCFFLIAVFFLYYYLSKHKIHKSLQWWLLNNNKLLNAVGKNISVCVWKTICWKQ